MPEHIEIGGDHTHPDPAYIVHAKLRREAASQQVQDRAEDHIHAG
jgi:hypothetical protein